MLDCLVLREIQHYLQALVTYLQLLLQCCCVQI